MKLEILEKKHNVLLERTELKGKFLFEGATPSNEVVTAQIANDLKVDKDLVVVTQILTKYSHREANFTAQVYDNAKIKDKLKVKTKYLKKKADEEKKKAEENKEGGE